MTILAPRARLALTSVLALLALVASSLHSPTPAHAFANYCGAALTGVGQDFVATRDNGHPLTEPGDLDGWNGRPGVFGTKETLFRLQRASEGITSTVSTLDRFGYGIPAKAIQVAIAATDLVFRIPVAVLEVSVLQLEHQNDRVNGCGGTLIADLADATFLLMMEQELATVDLDGSTTVSGSSTPDGVPVAPSAMFMLPQDGWPAWHRDASLYTDAPGHADPDMKEPYVHGALNGDYIGVAVWVRNQIAYLEAAGIDTGTTRQQVDPADSTRMQTVYGARDLYMQAMDLLAEGWERQAYQRLAHAYRVAVTAVPATGSSGSTTSDPNASGQVTPSPSPSPGPSPSPSTTPAPSPAPTTTFEPSESPEPSDTPTPSAPPADTWPS